MCLYLFKRNTTYYYRIKIPVDLRDHFSGKELIVKSLKTKNLSAAKVLASHLNSQVQNSFALLRVQGFDLAKPQGNERKPPVKLSRLIEMYITEKSSSWTQRTTDDFTNRLAIFLNRRVPTDSADE